MNTNWHAYGIRLGLQLRRTFSKTPASPAGSVLSLQCCPLAPGFAKDEQGERQTFQRRTPLQYRSLVHEDGWDLSCQGLESVPGDRDLEAIATKLSRRLEAHPASMFLLDLSCNCIPLTRMGILYDWLDKYPRLRLNLADNGLSWEQVKEDLGKREKLQWLKEARITLAASSQQSAFEQLLRQQLVTEESLSQVVETVNNLAKTTARLQKWQASKNFIDKEEMNAALEKQFAEKNIDLLEMPFKAILGPNGRHAFSFDGFYTYGQNLLVLEYEHSFDISDAEFFEAKAMRLRQVFEDLHLEKIPSGAPTYNQQMEVLEKYKDYHLLLGLGGVQISPGVYEMATSKNWVIVKPLGGRY